jgi:hypothetical protein
MARNHYLLYPDESARIIHIQGSKFRMLRLDQNGEGPKVVFSIDANKESSSLLEEVSARCQSYQYFTSSFFIQKFFAQLLCAYNLGLQIFGKRVLVQELLIKCWKN